MPEKPEIAIIGPGRLGRALGTALKEAGFRITEIVSRNSSKSQRNGRDFARLMRARASSAATARLEADVVWFCVPDREITRAVDQLALRTDWKGKVAIHSSGALSSDVLQGLRKRGAGAASVHPMMTFVHGAIPDLEGVPFAIEGDAAAVRKARGIVRAFGGHPIGVKKQDKVAYHAWGTFASPLLIAALVSAEQAAQMAGFSVATARRNMVPILRQTLANYARVGPGRAFSGPLVRGDAGIVEQHLRILKKSPAIRAVYVALARVAIQHLPVQRRSQLAELLRRAK